MYIRSLENACRITSSRSIMLWVSTYDIFFDRKLCFTRGPRNSFVVVVSVEFGKFIRIYLIIPPGFSDLPTALFDIFFEKQRSISRICRFAVVVWLSGAFQHHLNHYFCNK